MHIHGLQKLSMVDYPGKIAATVFTGGCNLRCPFCHNALLVTRLNESPRLEEEEVIKFLKSRRSLLDGVVLTGGEPLLQPGAADFLARVKDMGFAVKLDTNGCYPDILSRILEAGSVDYVAMDIKNCKEKYAATVGVPELDLTPVEHSIALLMSGKTDYEFRTTVVKELHTAEDIDAIGQWIRGAKRYFLQNFEDSGNLIADGFHGFSEEEIRVLSRRAAPHVEYIGVRGY